MPTQTVTFSSNPILGYGSVQTCDVCGATVVDWEKRNGEWTRERPNRDKHIAWHAAIGG